MASELVLPAFSVVAVGVGDKDLVGRLTDRRERGTFLTVVFKGVVVAGLSLDAIFVSVGDGPTSEVLVRGRINSGGLVFSLILTPLS